MIYAAILASEAGFWALLAAGLIARYPLRRPTLGAALLALTPLVDLILLTTAVIDIRHGAGASARHGLAAIYLGVSIAFGPRLIAWADARFAHLWSGSRRRDPAAYPASQEDRARREREGCSVLSGSRERRDGAGDAALSAMGRGRGSTPC